MTKAIRFAQTGGPDVLEFQDIPQPDPGPGEIRVNNQAIGVISVQSTTSEGRFSENDLRLLNTIAANVGAAIHNAQLPIFDRTGE